MAMNRVRAASWSTGGPTVPEPVKILHATVAGGDSSSSSSSSSSGSDSDDDEEDDDDEDDDDDYDEDDDGTSVKSSLSSGTNVS